MIHDQLSKLFRRNLTLHRIAHLALDLIGQADDPLHGDIALFAGSNQPVQQLLLLERLPPAVILDDHERYLLDHLVRRETTPATCALAAPPDGRALICRAGIDHAAIRLAAVRTTHDITFFSFFSLRARCAGTRGVSLPPQFSHGDDAPSRTLPAARAHARHSR